MIDPTTGTVVLTHWSHTQLLQKCILCNEVNGTRKKNDLRAVMKTHKDTCGMHVLSSVDPEKLGKGEGSRWRNTCVSWVYSSRVDTKLIKEWMRMEMMLRH